MLTNLKTPAVILLLLCICQQNVLAGNWEWGSDLGLASAWNDNPTLNSNATSTFRMVAIYNGEFSRSTPSSSINFRPKVTSDYYPDSQFQQLQSTDFFLPGSFRLTRPRTNWNLGYNLTRQSVLSDETTLADDGTLSNLNADDTVYRVSLSPGMFWTMSPKDQLSISVSLSATDYEKEFTRRADSTGGAIFASYSRSLTSRQSIGVTASTSKFDSDNETFIGIPTSPPTDPPTSTATLAKIDNTSTSESLSLDYKYKLSRTSLLNISFGLQKTETDNSLINLETGLPAGPERGPSTFESTRYNIGYTKSTERGNFGITGSRSVAASANGQPQDRYEMGFSGSTKLTQRLSGSWRLSASQQQNIILAATDGTFESKNRFYSARLGLNWRISRKWSIRGNYIYRYRDQDTGINSTESITTNSNAISAGISYVWKEIQ
jgi:hypothetical protein